MGKGKWKIEKQGEIVRLTVVIYSYASSWYCWGSDRHSAEHMLDMPPLLIFWLSVVLSLMNGSIFCHCIKTTINVSISKITVQWKKRERITCHSEQMDSLFLLHTLLNLFEAECFLFSCLLWNILWLLTPSSC